MSPLAPLERRRHSRAESTPLPMLSFTPDGGHRFVRAEPERRAIDSGRIVAEVIRELGIGGGLFDCWVDDERRRIEAAPVSGDQPLTAADAERAELASVCLYFLPEQLVTSARLTSVPRRSGRRRRGARPQRRECRARVTAAGKASRSPRNRECSFPTDTRV